MEYSKYSKYLKIENESVNKEFYNLKITIFIRITLFVINNFIKRVMIIFFFFNKPWS